VFSWVLYRHIYIEQVRSCWHPEEMQPYVEIQVFCLQSSAKMVNWGLIDPCSEGVSCTSMSRHGDGSIC